MLKLSSTSEGLQSGFNDPHTEQILMQDFEKSMQTLLEALKFSPNNLLLKKHVAEMLLQAGQAEKAIQFFKEILAEHDDWYSPTTW